MAFQKNGWAVPETVENERSGGSRPEQEETGGKRNQRWLTRRTCAPGGFEARDVSSIRVERGVISGIEGRQRRSGSEIRQAQRQPGLAGAQAGGESVVAGDGQGLVFLSLEENVEAPQNAWMVAEAQQRAAAYDEDAEQPRTSV